MSSKRYTEEFKIEAVKQVTERGHGIYSVASRLGITHTSLYSWIRRYGDQPVQHATITDQQAEINRLKAELQRVKEERDILKKATAYFAKESL
jgi:transposase